MSESKQIIDDILYALKRPGLYGYPESCEAIAQHAVHVCLVKRDPDWKWESTKTLWKQIAKDNGFGDHFSQQIYELDEYRENKWGDREPRASEHIFQVYRYVWEILKKEECVSWGASASWFEKLLDNPQDLGSPDIVDAVLGFLINNASPKCWDRCRDLYFTKCRAERGTASIGYSDYDTLDTWQDVPKNVEVDKENHQRVARGVMQILQHLGLIDEVV